MATAVVAGSTGLVGSQILSKLLAHPSYAAVHAYSRRELPNPEGSTKLHQITSSDTTKWTTQFPTSPTPKIFLSGLGTTRADAGGVQNQRAIDLDLNLALAKAAKEAGVDTYVLISSTGANSTSMFAYPKMKGELEDGVKALGFKHTIIIRPGFISGERTSRPTGVAESAIRWVAKGLGGVTPVLKDSWAQDGSTIARAAVVAGTMCVEGKKEEGVWEVGQAEIVKLGKE